MIRTQIQLTERQVETLRRIADKRGVSMAALIREAVDSIVEDLDYEARRQRAIAAIGRFEDGGGDVARDHDRYLDDAYSA